MKALSEYWPETQEINSFCVQQAELAHECVVLSTHQPLEFMRKREGGSADLVSANETDLIQAVLTPSEELTDGFKFIVISGDAGVGKSHYISWINSQLKRSKQSDTFHIVWIKKYDTLKTILSSILSPFSELPEFTRILVDLEGAIFNIQDNSGYAFQAGMNAAIEARLSEIKQELKSLTSENEGENRLRTLKINAGFLTDLRYIFNEPDLIEHCTTSQRGASANQDTGVFSRILNQVIEGKTFENLEKEEHLFHSYDLLDAFNGVEIDQLNARVSRFYMNKLKGSEKDKNIQLCLGLLNDLVDPATQFAFQINQSLGGRSFQDLLNEIRRELYKTGKELVFLIEDFVSMSGLQEQLLPTFVHGGRPEDKICKIRTVLAVTEDWFVGKSTYVQRKDDFVIKKAMSSEKEQLDLALNMVGAYLNASRFGVQDLSDLLSQLDGEVPEEWVPKFSASDLGNEEQQILDAFGKSPRHEFDLFPFNKHVIADFLKHETSDGSRLTFSARGIVRNLLLETVSKSKPDFDNSSFPQSHNSVKQKQIPAEMEGILGDVVSDEETKDRFRILLKRWAGGDLNFARESSFQKVAKAFGLEDIAKKFAEGSGGTISLPPSGRSPVPPPPDHPLVSTFKDIPQALDETIDSWSASKKLPQTEARMFRSFVASSINDYISPIDELDLFGKSSSEYTAKGENIKIPHAFGGKEAAEIDVGIDKAGRLRLVFKAMWRANHNIKGGVKFDYPGGLKDRAEIIAFITPLKEKYVEFKRRSFLKEAQFATNLLEFIEAHERLNTVLCSADQFEEGMRDNESYKKIFTWADRYSTHKEAFVKIRSDAERVQYIYQGTGKTPIAKNPNIQLKGSKNIKIAKEFENKYVRFFNYFKNDQHSTALMEAVNDVVKSIASETKTFFAGRRPNFEEDKRIFSEFIQLLTGSRWPGDQFTARELEALFNHFDGLDINELKAWENLKLTEIVQSKMAKGEIKLSLHKLIQVHHATQRLSLFFAQVEANNRYVPTGDGEQQLLKLREEIRTELANLENVTFPETV